MDKKRTDEERRLLREARKEVRQQAARALVLEREKQYQVRMAKAEAELHQRRIALLKAYESPTPEPKKVEPAAPCEHRHLKFDQGMFYLVCKKCGYVWVAVGHCPARAIWDLKSRGRTPKFPGRQDPGAGSDIA